MTLTFQPGFTSNAATRVRANIKVSSGYESEGGTTIASRNPSTCRFQYANSVKGQIQIPRFLSTNSGHEERCVSQASPVDPSPLETLVAD
jgi:hypothetical protein